MRVGAAAEVDMMLLHRALDGAGDV
ncbi:MAG: hypothetical protein JWO85_21, partial [Candidatus Eremiobacteraeota bacterium]|nr:hypothetical protein [Candidatus Eremiobacteraeota bacterium]